MAQAPIRRALLSVSDKTGLVDFAVGLRHHGVEIVSTGGTAAVLREAGIPIAQVDDFTGFPEILDGRVKTLHPRVHAGILYRRDLPGDVETMERESLVPIDLVAVNLYPFEQTVAGEGVEYEEAVEQIDIGGPSMIRSAAKNHAHVTVVVSPLCYAEVLEEMRLNGGGTTFEFRQRLALEAFERTAAYDGAIAEYFSAPVSSPPFPPEGAAVTNADAAENAASEFALPDLWRVSLPRTRLLRYGENPHQKAALYGSFLEGFKQLHGKDLSYNNILDLTAAQEMVEVLGRRGPAVAVLKHSNPCGAAVGSSLDDAWRKALATDPASASGGIVGCSLPVDEAAADAMKEHFIEVLVAPGYSEGALEILRRKRKRILLECTRPLFAREQLHCRSVPGGVLLQTGDERRLAYKDLEVVTQRAPSPEELEALGFAWEVVRFVKSNAILFARRDVTLAVGAGQMSRVDAARVAVMKAQQAGLDLSRSVVASDAFFPFPDAVLVAVDAGARAVIQPGGSVRDKEVIAAADDRGLAMVFTGVRQFRH